MEAAVASAKKPKLLDRVRSDLRVKRYSIRTEKAYIDRIRRFILFHGKRHPSEMGEQKISAFLTHLQWIEMSPLPTAPLPGTFNVFATTPCRSLSPSR